MHGMLFISNVIMWQISSKHNHYMQIILEHKQDYKAFFSITNGLLLRKQNLFYHQLVLSPNWLKVSVSSFKLKLRIL